MLTAADEPDLVSRDRAARLRRITGGSLRRHWNRPIREPVRPPHRGRCRAVVGTLIDLLKPIITSITLSIIASVIFSILGALLYRYLYLPYRRRTNALSRLSPIDFSKNPVYLCYGLISPSDAGKYYTVDQGDLSAIALGYQVLVENYGQERIRIRNCMATEPLLSEVSNVLTISGPRWNSITERYLGRLGSPLRFADNRKSVDLCKPDGSPQETFTNTYRPSGDPDACYGIVLGGSVSDGGRVHHVLICAGSNSFSTYGCVIILDKLRHERSLRCMAELKNQTRWGMIVRVQNLSPASTQSRRGRQPFESSHLDVLVERTLPEADFSEPYRYGPTIE